MDERSEPTSTTALATASLTTPRLVTDDPRQLDDAQLLEILQAFHTRTTTIGAVATVATGAVAVALSASLWFVALALMPAAVGGFVLSNRVVARASAARFGVTARCLREVERAFDVVGRRIDLRTMKARDFVRTDWPRMVALVKAELANAREHA
jgi:hypothetical protein